MTQPIVILALVPVKFPDEKTGEVVEGLQVHYLPSLTPENSARRKGCLPLKGFLRGNSSLDRFKELPGMYEVDIDIFGAGKSGPKLINIGGLLNAVTVAVAAKA